MTKKKWSFKTDDLLKDWGSIHMKFYMTGQEKMWPFNANNCLIDVTAWADFTVWRTVVCRSNSLQSLYLYLHYTDCQLVVGVAHLLSFLCCLLCLSSFCGVCLTLALVLSSGVRAVHFVLLYVFMFLLPCCDVGYDLR